MGPCPRKAQANLLRGGESRECLAAAAAQGVRVPSSPGVLGGKVAGGPTPAVPKQ